MNLIKQLGQNYRTLKSIVVDMTGASAPEYLIEEAKEDMNIIKQQVSKLKGISELDAEYLLNN